MSEIRRQNIERAALERALAHSNIPTLLPVLVQLTGDLSWMREPYLPERVRGLTDDDSGGLSPELQHKVRSAALEAVLAWHAGGEAAIPEPDRGTLHELMSAAIGHEARPEYADIFAADMRIREEGAPDMSFSGIATDVIIVGAGFSGMRAAIEFRSRGIPFTVIERSPDVGGVWLTSTYPGAGVDTPSQLYSLTTDPYPWSSVFARQPEMLRYARFVAERNDLRQSIRFDTEVTGAVWNEDSERWVVQTRSADGTADTLSARVLVSAVGTFAGAALPDIPGLDDFEGPVIHTAEWPADLDLRDKRVAVIGAGASAMQLVPAVVDQVGELAVFQRTPQWIAPVDDYFAEIPPEVDALTRWVPGYREWWRFRLATIWNDGAYPSLRVDKEWEDYPHSVNRINASQRRYYERYLREQLAGRGDLIENSLPKYPPFGKRLLLDNGWFAAIRKDHVRLIPRGVASLKASGVTDDSGETHEVDVVVFATGYTATDYLSTLPVTGAGGVRLEDVWQHENAKAYLGMTVPGFPNLFIMYGPNTHPGPGGSYLFIAEVEANYIAEAVEYIDAEACVLDLRPDVLDGYQAEVDATNEELVWGADLVRTYVKNSAGRVVIFLPWPVSDYWLRAHEFHSEDYRVRTRISGR